MPLAPITPPARVDPNAEYRFIECQDSYVLLLLQRTLDAITAHGTNGLATEATLAAIKAQTDQMVFTANKLRTTGEDGSGGGASNVISADETGNSTKTLLGAGATFTGNWEEVINYTTAAVAILGDNLTDGTLYIESSQDGGITVNSVPFNIPDTTFDLPHIWNLVESHIRIRYVNGSTAQTGFFQLQTKYSNGQELGLLQNAGDNITSETDVQVVKAISTGTDPNGNYRNGVSSGELSSNSSTTPLTGSGSFVGTWEDVSGYHGVSVLVDGTAASVADGTLYMEFSLDGVSTTRSIQIDVVDITMTSPRTLGVIANFFRVRYINGTTALTTFELETMVHTSQVNLVSRLNQALNDDEDVSNVRAVIAGKKATGEFDNVKITQDRELATSLFDSETGSRQIVDLNGAAKTGEAFVLVGDAFYGQVLNPLHWDTALTGSGSETPLPGTHRISTGTTANSKFCLQSVRPARFMIAQFNIAHFGIQLNTADLTDQNCIRRFGVFDPINTGAENGLFFEVTSLDGVNPQWYCVAIKDGVETQRIAQADFNGTSASLFNPMATVSAYEIQYNAGTAFFFQGSKFIHQVKGVAVYSGTYNFNVGFSIENINGNTADNLLDFRAGGVYRLGEPKGDPIGRAFTSNTLVKNGTGYISQASISRTGSSGGSGYLEVFDGLDNTGILMARIDVGGDDFRQITIGGTFTTGLYIQITGSGTNTANLSFE
jgi:hypothetical protein